MSKLKFIHICSVPSPQGFKPEGGTREFTVLETMLSHAGSVSQNSINPIVFHNQCTSGLTYAKLISHKYGETKSYLCFGNFVCIPESTHIYVYMYDDL